MSSPTIAPYGSWKSPLSADLVTQKSIGLGQIVLDGDDIYWLEIRPSESGRSVIVKRSADGKTSDVIPPTFNARTRVHEYGGGHYNVAEGIVYFSNFLDQRLYRQQPDQAPHALTPPVDLRYADYVMDKQRNRLIAVREDHTGQGEAVNTLVGISLAEVIPPESNPGQVLVSGNNFYASPRLSPDGKTLAWLTWNHPNMPWDGCELWTGEFDETGALTNQRIIAGSVTESIFQPEWSPDGVLYFVSDRSGWWNLYRWVDHTIQALYPMQAEFGLPMWVFRMSTYAFISPNQMICTYSQDGISHLASFDTVSRRLEEKGTSFNGIFGIQGRSGGVVLLAGSASQDVAVLSYDEASGKFLELRRASELTLDPRIISAAESIEFPTENGLTAYAFYYPPHNPDFQAPAGEQPPLVVMSHGGPTGASSPVLDLGIQYLTSRGIAVLDVNYGGSTGYSREYRQRLNGQWGIVDMDDCCNAALYLARIGKVDDTRLAITGGSAGGYTTLCALTFRNTFHTGASHFGVSDLEALALDTHKFESRYCDSMVGPYPERKDLYRERSPIHHTNLLSKPMILFQGLEDMVVPPSQAEKMYAAVKGKGLPVAYLPFEGEQHGFRKAENIKRAMEAELYFFSKMFGFDLADEVEPVAIDNFK